MRQWEAQINRLIKAAAQRRASERTTNGIARIAAANSTSLVPQPRFSSKISQSQSPYNNNAPQSMYSTQSSASANSRGPRTPYSSDEQVANPNSGMYGSGPQGYPPHDGFEFEPDEDDFEDYPPSSSYVPSGRGTPVGFRRNNNALSMPPERDSVPGYDRPRAQTEDTNGPVMAQWRNGLPPVPTPPQPRQETPNSTLRPYNARMNSNMSTQSYASESSFGNAPPNLRSRPPLRSQFSSTKLKSVYDTREQRNSNAPSPVMTNAHGHTITNRSRSASQPIAYVPQSVPPPMPTAAQWNRDRSNTAMGTNGNKRGSGSSQDTGDSSDYSPNSSSPITPFGSSESSLGAIGIRTSRSQHFDGGMNGHGPPVKVKVHFHEDIFVIQVARSTEYDDLVEKVGRKIRLCGPRRDDGPLRVKYKDEDGDMVSLGSTEDVQMAFEQYRPGGQVTLFVT
jgi:cell division control protein 24